MRYLLDTGILLRLVNRADPLFPSVRNAARTLRARGHTFCTATQNAAEFWNVCTRPGTVRGGLGLSLDEAARRLRIIERGVTVLSETDTTYQTWKALIVSHSVHGVQVHDARLAALMASYVLTHLLTLNKAEFSRYSFLQPLTPADLTGFPSP